MLLSGNFGSVRVSWPVMADPMFSDWLPRQRWYAGRTRQLTGVSPQRVVVLRDGLEVVLLEATFAAGGPERYQVLVGWGRPGQYPEQAHIGHGPRGDAYDALYDPASARYVLELIAADATRDGVTFTAEPGAVLPVGAAPRVSGAEQSNTSVIFGRDAMLKVFRRLTRGVNPDIELNRALARAGNRHVARLLGAIETSWDGEPFALAMVTSFAADASEGWAMATADRAGFLAEAYPLGEAVASVHAALAEQLGTETVPFPVEVFSARLATAAATVDALGEYVPAALALYRALDGTRVPVQRVHGDLHLGQVLRTPGGWLVIDFEGEPGQPLPDRRRPDASVRDVAGMLRSFDYAAAGDREWAQRVGALFCDGYAAAAGVDPRDDGELLVAYELDKALYEVAYEARYRPDWLPIPMGAVARLLI